MRQCKVVAIKIYKQREDILAYEVHDRLNGHEWIKEDVEANAESHTISQCRGEQSGDGGV
jgi:hypothetical protein